ncbi:hypothetical protein GCM10007860_35650 [Chitiniphilus shinanonensis]|uniref:Uncharacterized protein n=1 Tax=Chitiniphilus shinanonensis TaxID=553088 RepID=A0ABQ6BX98_9NEIS|nr:hypothetical protein GCM10007860_35650 [Chitiniphilus shinanonensis]
MTLKASVQLIHTINIIINLKNKDNYSHFITQNIIKIKEITTKGKEPKYDESVDGCTVPQASLPSNLLLSI